MRSRFIKDLARKKRNYWFALPIGILGALLLGAMIWHVAKGSPSETSFIFGLAGLVLSTGGFGFFRAGHRARQELMEENRLQEDHPDRPWMWRPEWFAGWFPP